MLFEELVSSHIHFHSKSTNCLIQIKSKWPDLLTLLATYPILENDYTHWQSEVKFIGLGLIILSRLKHDYALVVFQKEFVNDRHGLENQV